MITKYLSPDGISSVSNSKYIYGYYNQANVKKLVQPIISPIAKNGNKANINEFGVTSIANSLDFHKNIPSAEEYILLNVLWRRMVSCCIPGNNFSNKSINTRLDELKHILIYKLGFDLIAEVEVDILTEINEFSSLISDLNHTFNSHLSISAENIKEYIKNSDFYVYRYSQEFVNMEVVVSWLCLQEIIRYHNGKQVELKIPLDIFGLRYLIGNIYADYTNKNISLFNPAERLNSEQYKHLKKILDLNKSYPLIDNISVFKLPSIEDIKNSGKRQKSSANRTNKYLSTLSTLVDYLCILLIAFIVAFIVVCMVLVFKDLTINT